MAGPFDESQVGDQRWHLLTNRNTGEQRLAQGVDRASALAAMRNGQYRSFDPKLHQYEKHWSGPAAAWAEEFGLGYGDEIMAGAQTVWERGDRDDYQENLTNAQIRQDLWRKANEEEASLAETTGAVSSLITPTGPLNLAARAGYGGTQAAAKLAARGGGPLASMATKGVGYGGMGAAAGAGYGYGVGRGGQAVENIPEHAAFGAAAGVAVPAALKIAGAAASPIAPFLGWVGKRFGLREQSVVKDEIRNIAEQSGKPMNEVMEELAQGSTLGEVSETTRRAVLGYQRALGGQGPIEANTARSARQATDRAQTTMARGMTPDLPTNAQIAKRQDQEWKQYREIEDLQYDNVWRNAPDLSDDLVNGITNLLLTRPGLRGALTDLYKAAGETPFFREGAEGAVELARRPTLRDMERIRRQASTLSNKAYRDGDGEVGEIYGNLEQQLRDQLDEMSPALAQTREMGRQNRSFRDAFKEGRKIWTMSPDDVARMLSDMSDETKAGLHRGAMQALNDRLRNVGARATLFRDLQDPSSRMGEIYRMLMPDAADAKRIGDLARKFQAPGRGRAIPVQQRMERAAQEAAPAINRAARATELARMTGTRGVSPTAITQGYRPGQMTQEALDAGISGGMTGVVAAIGRNLLRWLMSGQLSPAQMEKIASLLTDPDKIEEVAKILNKSGTIKKGKR